MTMLAVKSGKICSRSYTRTLSTTMGLKSDTTTTQKSMLRRMQKSQLCSGTDERSETVRKPVTFEDQSTYFLSSAFHTAVALAVYDSKHRNQGPIPKVTENHLKQVVSMSSAFRNYIKAAHNDEDHSARAFRLQNRDDKAPSGPPR